MKAAGSPGARGAARHKAALLQWLEVAVADGWISEAEIERLESLEIRSADQLFEQAAGGRPLTVGFFGGTGVGKSSLLNRLVGEPVAEVGVERPTSTEVTVYVHDRYPLTNLPDNFPVERVRVRTHHRDEYRDVVWVDMPDIDSVATNNRELVYEWLPCIDWIVYVVSPEKYRDDIGWRVLRERSHRHHWLFVINRWDTGHAQQYVDFERLLKEAGLADPLVLRTSCTETAGDDFDSMARLINEAVAEHGLEQLQQVGERARLDDLSRCCDHYSELLGDTERWRTFAGRAHAAASEKLQALNRYLLDEASIQAAGVPDSEARRQTAEHQPAVPGLLDDGIQDLESAILVGAEGLPVSPVRVRLRSALETLRARVTSVLEDAFRQGASRPGGAIQRAIVAAMRKLTYGLPLLAGAGMAYVVVTRYSEGLAGTGEFLGVDFLAHSLMVLGLAALLPYLLGRMLRPSVRRAILKRVDKGLRNLSDRVLAELDQSVASAAEQARARREELEAIRREIETGRGKDNAH